jgi:hypothetical protein
MAASETKGSYKEVTGDSGHIPSHYDCKSSSSSVGIKMFTK